VALARHIGFDIEHTGTGFRNRRGHRTRLPGKE
jgi:hypothetical protein